MSSLRFCKIPVDEPANRITTSIPPNTHMKKTHTQYINPIALEAASTFEIERKPSKKRKSRTFKDTGTRTLYALVASGKQMADDDRLPVIEDFVKTVRKVSHGRIRSFIISTLYNAIVAKAEESSKLKNDTDDTFIRS